MNNSDKYQLRAPANDAEWRSYHEIRRAVLWEARGQGSAYDPNRPDERLPNRFAQIFFVNSLPVGVMRIDVEAHQAIFRRVAVKIEHQRQGHGRRMLMLAEKFARNQGCASVRSGVALDAVGFYERCGFRRIVTENAGASVAMEKVL